MTEYSWAGYSAQGAKPSLESLDKSINVNLICETHYSGHHLHLKRETNYRNLAVIMAWYNLSQLTIIQNLAPRACLGWSAQWNCWSASP